MMSYICAYKLINYFLLMKDHSHIFSRFGLIYKYKYQIFFTTQRMIVTRPLEVKLQVKMSLL